MINILEQIFSKYNIIKSNNNLFEIIKITSITFNIKICDKINIGGSKYANFENELIEINTIKCNIFNYDIFKIEKASIKVIGSIITIVSTIDQNFDFIINILNNHYNINIDKSLIDINCVMLSCLAKNIKLKNNYELGNIGHKYFEKNRRLILFITENNLYDIQTIYDLTVNKEI